MNAIYTQVVSQLSKFDRRHIQFAMLVITISLLALGASAPGALGDY
jgi:hypothetical protein